jgi:hypothetical protein
MLAVEEGTDLSKPILKQYASFSYFRKLVKISVKFDSIVWNKLTDLKLSLFISDNMFLTL